MIDSHCHLDFAAFDADRNQVIERSRQIGIDKIIIPGVAAYTFPRVKNTCNEYNECLAAYGLHPYFIDDHNEQDLITLDHWLETENAVGVGECGLDFYLKELDKEKQLEYFYAQLELAVKHRLPVIIHSRKATEQIIKALRKYPSLSGMIHSYSGSLEQANQLIDMGFYLSFGGAITYERATKLRNMVQQLPLESLLIETDSPDQPGSLHNKQRNEPGFITETLTTLSELKSLPIEIIATQTTKNTKTLFNL